MSKLIKELVLASHNPGKLKELQAMLGAQIKVRPVSEFSQIEPEETGLSFVENAILKARHAARVSGLPALAELHENRHYELAGLCRSPLDAMVHAEREAQDLLGRFRSLK